MRRAAPQSKTLTRDWTFHSIPRNVRAEVCEASCSTPSYFATGTSISCPMLRAVGSNPGLAAMTSFTLAPYLRAIA